MLRRRKWPDGLVHFVFHDPQTSFLKLSCTGKNPWVQWGGGWDQNAPITCLWCVADKQH